MEPNDETKLKTSNAEADSVAEKLRQEIFSGARLPRERLIESNLAKTYSVHRMVIRQVLSLLEKEDLVVIEPFRGATVSDISLSKIAENYQVMAMLEGFATKMATKNITQTDIDSLKAIVKKQKIIGVKDVKEWQALNNQFHRTINLKCNNEKLIKLLRQNTRFTSYWFLVLSTFGRISEGDEEHTRIVDALSKRDADLAAKLVEKHILDAGEYLIRSIHENLPLAVFKR